MPGSEKASRYRLKVTAGPDYDPATHQDVPVNEDQTLYISNSHASTNLAVRIQNYTGNFSPSHITYSLMRTYLTQPARLPGRRPQDQHLLHTSLTS